MRNALLSAGMALFFTFLGCLYVLDLFAPSPFPKQTDAFDYVIPTFMILFLLSIVVVSIVQVGQYCASWHMWITSDSIWIRGFLANRRILFSRIRGARCVDMEGGSSLVVGRSPKWLSMESRFPLPGKEAGDSIVQELKNRNIPVDDRRFCTGRFRQVRVGRRVIDIDTWNASGQEK